MNSSRKPSLEVGYVSSLTNGTSVKIGGSAQETPYVPAMQQYAAGEPVLIAYLNDDCPVVLGYPGYKRGGAA